MPSWASVSRETASGVSVPGLGRWVTVAFSVALLWMFGFAAEARAADELAPDEGTIAAVADTETTTEDVASTDAGSGDSVGTVTEGTTGTTDTTSGGLSAEDGSTVTDGSSSTTTEPVDTSTRTEPTDPTLTTDPVATDPPPEPAPTPEPILPIIEPTPTTETPTDTPLPPAAGSGPTDSIVVIDGPLVSALLPASQGTTLAALIDISRAVTDRGSALSPAREHPGKEHPAPAAPDLPQLPAPHNPSAPANPAPGGVGGSGSAPLGVLAALFALAFAGLLGEVLPVSVAALRPPDLAFHLKRPG